MPGRRAPRKTGTLGDLGETTSQEPEEDRFQGSVVKAIRCCPGAEGGERLLTRL